MNGPTRVLVVDDDPKIRAVVRRGLAYEGYRVVEAASGEEGLEKAREHLPALVVLDIMLPGIDGLEVTRRLRSAGDQVAILMLTARDEVRDRVVGLESERAAIVADARDEAERMGRLIGDLLALARAESGARLEFAPVELDALLVESVRRQREAAPHVRMSVSGVTPAVVDGDDDRLRELIGILLDNAARYTPTGGSVAAGLAVRNGRAIIRVEDTGIGLDAEDRERLFERLYRGARARELRPAGTGLGLAIARWIVDAHAGTIELADRDGGGTVALVSLPARTP